MARKADLEISCEKRDDVFNELIYWEVALTLKGKTSIPPIDRGDHHFGRLGHHAYSSQSNFIPIRIHTRQIPALPVLQLLYLSIVCA